MRGQVIIAAVSAAGLLVCLQEAVANGKSHHRRARYASEVRIQQSHGNIPPGVTEQARGRSKSKLAPESGSNPSGAAAGSPTTPVTCNQQNASSPACYSATQQARPPTR
ncbi:MAG: hypothetical protein BGP05_19070 [Rhizobiales bacterium 62-47]|nr:MAG: hypothetical protein BGP05_19070 [Rhizobiales bacterium 62-47]